MTRACEEVRVTIRAAAEGVVVPISDEVALHLDECSHCRHLFDLGKIDLPKEGFEVLDEAARRKMIVALGSTRLSRPTVRRRAAAVTAAAAIVVIAVGLGYLSAGRPTAARVADALVEDHIRYLGHPDRNSASDSATLQDHLESYVDFPVRLDIPPQSRLTGGRRCFVLGRRVALIFYETPDGATSHFVLAADGLSTPGRVCPGALEFACGASRGYCLVSWESAGLLHVLVGPRERPLLEMARACRSAATG